MRFVRPDPRVGPCPGPVPVGFRRHSSDKPFRGGTGTAPYGFRVNYRVNRFGAVQVLAGVMMQFVRPDHRVGPCPRPVGSRRYSSDKPFRGGTGTAPYGFRVNYRVICGSSPSQFVRPDPCVGPRSGPVGFQRYSSGKPFRGGTGTAPYGFRRGVVRFVGADPRVGPLPEIREE